MSNGPLAKPSLGHVPHKSSGYSTHSSSNCSDVLAPRRTLKHPIFSLEESLSSDFDPSIIESDENIFSHDNTKPSLVTSTSTRSRSAAHHRMKSTYFELKEKRGKRGTKATALTEKTNGKKVEFGFERQVRAESKLGIVPTLGDFPCTAFCPHCSQDVHTALSYEPSHDSNWSLLLLTVLDKLFSCCHPPVWLQSLRVHLCSRCHQVIGRSL